LFYKKKYKKCKKVYFLYNKHGNKITDIFLSNNNQDHNSKKEPKEPKKEPKKPKKSQKKSQYFDVFKLFIYGII
jgi:hypothetical protein